MKKLIAFVTAILLILLSSVAIADVDVSGLSYDELVDLVNKAQYEMMKTDKWEEVVVPEGIYIIGRDIPAGRWTISAPPKVYVIYVYVGKTMYDEFSVNFDSMTGLHGTQYSLYKEGDTSSITYDLKDGMILQIKSGSGIFTPYTGNGFSFK